MQFHVLYSCFLHLSLSLQLYFSAEQAQKRTEESISQLNETQTASSISNSI